MTLPTVIPPKSAVRLARADVTTPNWNGQIGRTFRVGYYSRNDGLDCIWLVNALGEYEQTTDRQALIKYFDIVRISKEQDYFGVSKPALRKLIQRSKPRRRTAATR